MITVAASNPFLLIILILFFSVNTREKVSSDVLAMNSDLPASATTTALVLESINADVIVKSSGFTLPNLIFNLSWANKLLCRHKNSRKEENFFLVSMVVVLVNATQIMKYS